MKEKRLISKVSDKDYTKHLEVCNAFLISSLALFIAIGLIVLARYLSGQSITVLSQVVLVITGFIMVNCIAYGFWLGVWTEVKDQ